MTIDTNIPLATILHAGAMIVTIVGFYYKLSGRVERIEQVHQEQQQALMRELSDIKERVGCAEDGAQSIVERLATVERDVLWLKNGKDKE